MKNPICPICGAREATTKEDLIPQWSRRAMMKSVRRTGSEITSPFPGDLMPICEPCNNEFGKEV